MRLITVAALLFLTVSTVAADTAAGVSWTAPAGWTRGADRQMRAATYSVPAAAGDTAAGECVVNFFGPGQGGSVQDNVDRWKSQFQGADGKPSAAKVGSRTVRGLKVTTVDESGTYSGMGGPMAVSPTSVKNYRLLGAIVEAPGGMLFFKFTGPAKTVGANAAKFEQLLASLTPQAHL
jgi:hypothetical protein